jgi:UPF0176 protein
MENTGNFQIISFYEFKDLGDEANLKEIKGALKTAMIENSILGTFIIAAEGYNSTVCGFEPNIKNFISAAESILETRLNFKSSFFSERPFHKIKVKIKTEIVRLRQKINLEKGFGTHVKPSDWNRIIQDPEVIILDTRNDYEVEIGTFKGAINPNTEKFSDLPKFVEENLNPEKHKKVAMFCTGGIRCEKFAPFLKEKGFEEIFQLEGGILKYLEETAGNESLWEGECFVFDDRIAVDNNLRPGKSEDLRPLSINPPQKK